MHGGVARNALGKENIPAVRKGCSNLERHLKNLKKYGVPAVVAINRFITDTDREVNAVKNMAKKMGAEVIRCNHWADGGKGTVDLAKHVVKLADSGKARFKPLYPDNMPLLEKIETVTKNIYGAKELVADAKICQQLQITHQYI